MSAFLSGFALSLSLILSIGAQNAFVLRQGLRRLHVGPVVLTCVLSEAFLIASGVAGFGALMGSAPYLASVARWGGAAFLLMYGALSLWRAFTATETLEGRGAGEQSLRAALISCLAVTWLNPHVYLDTVFLLGAVATQYGAERWVFGAGAISGSTAFFVALGYGGARLQPVFARPLAWRVLDTAVALVMWSVAASLILT